MSSQTWLTQEAADRLAAELADLETVGRTEVIKKIEAARAEGDLKENGGYHAAKEEQGKIEARINRLEEMLANATIGEADSGDGIVKQGLMIHCKLNGKENEFFLGSHEIFEGTKYETAMEEGDFSVYSPDSPIGQAILGKKIGEKVSYSAPNGKEISVEITGLKNFVFSH